MPHILDFMNIYEFYILALRPLQNLFLSPYKVLSLFNTFWVCLAILWGSRLKAQIQNNEQPIN